MLTRRQFLKVAMAGGAAVVIPPVLESLLDAARAAGPAATGYFLDATRWATCAAICAQIVPTGSDPATDPGATEANAVVFIDRFLSAFELPASVADNPAIYVSGPNSGRNPYPNGTGGASSDFPPDDFLTAGTTEGSGLGHFLTLTPLQELSWRCQLYGTAALQSAPSFASAWAAQVGGLLAAPTGLQQAYAEGLDAYDSYSQSLFGTPFASASPLEQELMLGIAGNLILGAIPLPLPSPPAAPAAATALYPIITLHTYQATYGIPEYAWRNQVNDPSVEPLVGTAQWRQIDYVGDTQPLGNSIFDPDLYGPGEGPNQGFGEEGVFVPFGGYTEYRPVSTQGSGGTVIGAGDIESLSTALTVSAGRIKRG